MYKRDFYWNSLAALINAAEAVIMSMIVTRVTNLSDAGILTIAFAVGNLLMTIGKFGVRNYQATDTTYRYDYSVFLSVRYLTATCMMISLILYLIVKMLTSDTSTYKLSSIAAICAIYIIESIEDVIWGEYQRRKRLDLGAKLFVFRWLAIIVLFSILIWLTRNLPVALWGCFFVSGIIFFLVCNTLSKTYHREQVGFNFDPWKLSLCVDEIILVLKDTWPLFIVGFLTFYINNSPKYALDATSTSEIQACYGFVSMPVFVIGLLNSMLYQPSVVWLAEHWECGEIGAFRHRIRKQCLWIILISCMCLVGAAFVGIQVLSIIYNTDLRAFWKELVILQISGMFLALAGFLSVLLTIMRNQKGLMKGYLFVAALALLGMRYSAINYGTLGVTLYYLLCNIMLCIIYGGMYIKIIKK